MAEDNSDSNVTQLLRLQTAPKPPALRPASIEEQIETLMGDAEADEPAASSEASQVWLPPPVAVPTYPQRSDPPTGHRNGMFCPQCEQWIWRYSPDCRHCDVNLEQYRAELEALRVQDAQAFEARRIEHERKRWLKRAGVLTFSGVISILVASRMPGSLQGMLLWGGMCTFVAGMLLAKFAE